MIFVHNVSVVCYLETILKNIDKLTIDCIVQKQNQ